MSEVMIKVLKMWRDLEAEQVDHEGECAYADNCISGCCDICDRISDELDKARVMRNAILRGEAV